MGGTVHIDEYTHTVTTAERVKRTIGALLKASPSPSPVGRGTEIVLQNTNKSNFKTPLYGEGRGEETGIKGLVSRKVQVLF